MDVPRVEQATAAPGEFRVVSDWQDNPVRCTATRVVQRPGTQSFVQRCVLPSGHAGSHCG